jgi:hypothetical protein
MTSQLLSGEPKEDPRTEETRRKEAQPGGPDEEATKVREDAPEGHSAHLQVKKRQGKFPIARWYTPLQCGYTPPGFQVASFQVTPTQCGGSMDEALRICRLCFVRAEGGAKIEELKKYKAELLAALKARAGAEEGPKEETKPAPKRKFKEEREEPKEG